MRAGIALKPGTDAEAVLPYLDSLDQVLVMTVGTSQTFFMTRTWIWRAELYGLHGR
jgi:pentose-5-phosphate-3-epimerase